MIQERLLCAPLSLLQALQIIERLATGELRILNDLTKHIIKAFNKMWLVGSRQGWVKNGHRSARRSLSFCFLSLSLSLSLIWPRLKRKWKWKAPEKFLEFLGSLLLLIARQAKCDRTQHIRFHPLSFKWRIGIVETSHNVWRELLIKRSSYGPDIRGSYGPKTRSFSSESL